MVFLATKRNRALESIGQNSARLSCETALKIRFSAEKVLETQSIRA
jgi:hypothetical protein